MNPLIRLTLRLLFLPIRLLLGVWGVRLPGLGTPRFYLPPPGRGRYPWS